MKRLAAIVAATLLLVPASAQTTGVLGKHCNASRFPLMAQCRSGEPCSAMAALVAKADLSQTLLGSSAMTRSCLLALKISRVPRSRFNI
jgi:hypothetical protein